MIAMWLAIGGFGLGTVFAIAAAISKKQTDPAIALLPVVLLLMSIALLLTRR